MKNKKGFTLVELLAVIAILAILVIMALPAVLRMFNSARKDSFTNEVNTILRTARQQYLLSGGTQTAWSNASGSTSTLDLTGNSHLQYYVKMNNEGKITKLQVSNGDFQYNVTNNNGIDVASSSDVQEVTEENELVITSSGHSDSEYVHILNGTSYDSEDAMLQVTSTTYGIPAFIKTAYENQQVWCIHHVNDDYYNSCNNMDYFNTESECNNEIQGWGEEGDYCQYEAINIPVDVQVGFEVNNTKYYLNASAEAYESNKQVVKNAFGVSNCAGDIAMSNTKRALMNILGIINVNAQFTYNPSYIRGHNSSLEVSVNSYGYISLTAPLVNDKYNECEVFENGILYCQEKEIETVM